MPAFRFMPTTRPSSRSASTETQTEVHDEMTTIDNALTRPWTVDKTYG
jgi:hypothetical protein